MASTDLEWADGQTHALLGPLGGTTTWLTLLFATTAWLATMGRGRCVMDKAEMKALLLDHLASYRIRSYEDLVASVETDRVDAEEVKGPSGTAYQIEVCYVWDDKRGGDVRVCGSIDEKPPRPLLGFLPIYVSVVNDAFIMRSDGTFVGE